MDFIDYIMPSQSGDSELSIEIKTKFKDMDLDRREL
mgnify:FL=1